MCVPFLLSGVKRSFEPGVLRRNGTERRNEHSDAQLSNFYGFNNQPALESFKRRAFISAGALPFMREGRSNGDYDAFIVNWRCR